MDIMTMAKELGTMIKNSEQMTNLKKSEQDVQNDDKARTILNDYGVLREEMVKALEKDGDNVGVEDIKKMILVKHEEINTYEVTKKYVEANQEYEKLMKTINDVITFAITGEDPCSSHDCGSCGCGCK